MSTKEEYAKIDEEFRYYATKKAFSWKRGNLKRALYDAKKLWIEEQKKAAEPIKK